MWMIHEFAVGTKLYCTKTCDIRNICVNFATV